VGNLQYLLSRAAWIVHYRWRATKSINFILKFYLYPGADPASKFREGDISNI